MAAGVPIATRAAARLRDPSAGGRIGILWR